MASLSIPLICRALRAVCPYCGHEVLERSRRRTLADWALSLLAFRPYRCPACDRRFHAVPDLMRLPLNDRERAWLQARPRQRILKPAGAGSDLPVRARRASAG